VTFNPFWDNDVPTNPPPAQGRPLRQTAYAERVVVWCAGIAIVLLILAVLLNLLLPYP